MLRRMTARLGVALISGAMIGLAAGAAAAAENATGIYLLGFRGPLAGVTPPPGVYVENDIYLYDASVGGGRRLLLGGTLAANVDGEAQLDAPSVIWVTPAQVLGGQFGMTFTWPLGRTYAAAGTTIDSPVFGRNRGFISDETSAIGDPLLSGFLGWNAGKFHWQAVAMLNIPVGDYRKDALSNVAFHRWAGDLTGTFTWLDPETGIDLSAAAGFTFNGENPETDYWTGTEFHLEWAATKSFGEFSLGLVGYHYQQVTGDGGSGATLGDFEGQVTALGGSVAYNFTLGTTPVTARLKVYREFAAENRLEGTSALLTLSLPLSIDASHAD
ncbi:transporter [Inquilinus sp.]|uniref:SphA family protein n=1 Tax=Inquilinus sp. TaxID=1932117 RepID=UPI0031DFAB22